MGREGKGTGKRGPPPTHFCSLFLSLSLSPPPFNPSVFVTSLSLSLSLAPIEYEATVKEGLEESKQKEKLVAWLRHYLQSNSFPTAEVF